MRVLAPRGTISVYNAGMASPMKDWNEMREMCARLLLERTGKDVAAWNQILRQANPVSEVELRAFLAEGGVTGYAQMILVQEQFGYPEYFLRTAEELIDAQYQAHPHLRPILDAIIAIASEFGEVTIQARKTYVSLLTPRRTFARVQVTKKGELILALRIKDISPFPRLSRSKVHESTPFETRFSSLIELDDDLIACLRQAYTESL